MNRVKQLQAVTVSMVIDVALLLGHTFSGDCSDRRCEAADAAFEAFPNLRIIASTARRPTTATTIRIVDRIDVGNAFAAGVLHVLLDDEADLERAAEAGLGLTVLKHALPGDASFHMTVDLQAFLDGHRDVRRSVNGRLRYNTSFLLGVTDTCLPVVTLR